VDGDCIGAWGCGGLCCPGRFYLKGDHSMANIFQSFTLRPEPTRDEQIKALQKKIAFSRQLVRAFNESKQFARWELEKIKLEDLEADLEELQSSDKSEKQGDDT
jgi:hypothetical protein